MRGPGRPAWPPVAPRVRPLDLAPAGYLPPGPGPTPCLRRSRRSRFPPRRSPWPRLWRQRLSSRAAPPPSSRATRAAGRMPRPTHPQPPRLPPRPPTPLPWLRFSPTARRSSGPSPARQPANRARSWAQNRELDFVFYSLESGPFDIMTTGLYMAGVAEGSGAEVPHPLILRVPPVRDGEDAARANVGTALDVGVAAIVFPHVESSAEAAVAVSAMGDELWPGNPSGSLLSILIIEDRSGVRAGGRDRRDAGRERRLRRPGRPAPLLRRRHGSGGGRDPDRPGRVPGPRGAVRHHCRRRRHRRADRSGLPHVHRERRGRRDGGRTAAGR